MLLLLRGPWAKAGEAVLPDARPVPEMQVLPLPYDQASFQHLGDELTRYHFGAGLKPWPSAVSSP